ncbi:MAG: hypothetical protein ACJ749_11625 [Flavisolibacter sp.]
MKKLIPFLAIAAIALVLFASCAHKNYTTSAFDQQTSKHRIIAILPAEMIFTGTQPKNLSPEDIAKIEENESRAFQNSLFNGILRYANTKKYTTYVSIQDISTTIGLLEKNNISIRDSWKEDDKKLASVLGVDAVVRMRINKKRYMSDLASMGIGMGKDILNTIGGTARFPVPYVSNKTNDIYASCNVVSNNQTLWNDNYEAGTDYNRPSEYVIDNITDNFGRHFPYRKRR